MFRVAGSLSHWIVVCGCKAVDSKEVLLWRCFCRWLSVSSKCRFEASVVSIHVAMRTSARRQLAGVKRESGSGSVSERMQ
jgi:hypothetical protein